VEKRKYQLNTKRMNFKILDKVYRVSSATIYGLTNNLDIECLEGKYLSIDGFIVGEIKDRDDKKRPYYIYEVQHDLHHSREEIIEESIKSIDERIKLLQDQKAEIQEL
jgi:hypothetical protein